MSKICLGGKRISNGETIQTEGIEQELVQDIMKIWSHYDGDKDV